MNFNFNETAGASQSQSLPQLEGNKVHEVTFKGCELRDITGVKDPSQVYKVLDIKFTTDKGYYTDTVFEPKLGDEKRQENEIGGKKYVKPSNIENMMLEFRHLIDAVNPELGKQIDSKGRVQYTTGGVMEYIPRDTDHIHQYTNPAITYPGLLDALGKIPEDGGSVERDFFCGITLYQELKKAFYDKDFLRYNPEASKKFDIPIETLVGAGVEINVIPLYTLEEMGFGNRGLVIDWSVPSFTPVTHPGWDMKVEKDIEEKGKQIYKEQWIGIKGIERRYQQYQHMLVFPHI